MVEARAGGLSVGLFVDVSIDDSVDGGAAHEPVTVLMPVYNTPPGMLGAAIESILCQSFPRFEFLIVDDGSEAVDTRRALESWAARDARIRIAREEAQERILSDPWIAEVVRATGHTTSSDVSPGEVLKQMALNQRDITSGNAMRVAKILRDLHWTKEKRHATRGQLYKRPISQATCVDNTVGISEP